MAAFLQHAERTRSILSTAAAAVNMPMKSFLLHGDAYVASRDPDSQDHFNWLRRFAPNLKFEAVPASKWLPLLQQNGPWATKSLLFFPNDGIVSPQFFLACAKVLAEKCTIDPRARLIEILLGEDVDGGVKVQGAVMQLQDGSKATVTTNHLVLSLGPGASLKMPGVGVVQRLSEMRRAGEGIMLMTTMIPSLLLRWICNQV